MRIVLCFVLCGLLGCAGNSRAPIEDRAARPQPQNASYTVKRGDTLYSIAFRYGKDFRRVAAANGITPPYTIYPGQQIRLDETPQAASVTPASTFPAAATSAAVPVATPAPIPTPMPTLAPPAVPASRSVTSPGYPQSPSVPASTPPQPAVATPADQVPAATLPAVEPPPASSPPAPPISTHPTEPPPQTAAIVPAAAPATQTSQAAPNAKPTSGAETFAGEKVAVWRWPTAGPVIRGYSESLHKGIDIGGARGDPVTAVAAGKVVYAGTGIAGFGELLIIKHNDVYLSAYGHNDELLVAEGDTVAAGQTIAQKGSSGTDSVKLHFEIRQEGKPIDPQRLLPGR